MTDDTIATFTDPTFQVAPEDITELCAKIGRAAGFPRPFHAGTVKMVVEHVAASYRITRWIAAQGMLGPDTLDELAKLLPPVLELLEDGVNAHRLISELVPESFGNRIASGEAYGSMLLTLDAIRLALPQAHEKRRRGHPVTHPDLNQAYRTASRHFKRIFFRDELLGRAAWTDARPPRPKHLSAIFIYGVMKLAAPDHPKLAEGLRHLMEEEVRATPGPRPGRPDR